MTPLEPAHLRLCLTRAFGWQGNPATLQTALWLDCMGPHAIEANAITKAQPTLHPVELDWGTVLGVYRALTETGALEPRDSAAPRPRAGPRIDSSDVYFETTVYGVVWPAGHPGPAALSYHFALHELASGLDGPDAGLVHALFDRLREAYGLGRFDL
ncbi:MAG: hypothetical protein KDD82_10780 [Planctomycetes bacterium]|nr:hypothetical protein [Planctomycetota bacterium]